MKYKGRHIQRGKPLLKMCNDAQKSKHEYGPNDDKIYCYGLIDSENEEALDECKECKAYVFNL